MSHRRSRRALTLALLWTGLSTLLTAQSLTHQRFELPNGMTVILLEDHSLPVTSINLWYRVGAVNEPPGRSGFAHLFEHLMFMGTRRVPGSDFDNLMEEGGGANNASTSLDRTNYFSWGPASLLPTLLWLEADRLEELGSEMTMEKLQLQCDVVRNEIRQNVENSPYGRAYEESYQLLYPRSHPYHKGVYGTHEDLQAATVNDVKDFFATFYVPDNCSLVVAGDFDSSQIQPLIARLFGDLPRGCPPVAPSLPRATLDREVRRTMFDKVQLPRINVCYHSPPSYAPGDAETELIADMLASGKASRLYQRLVVKDKTVVSVSASQDSAAMGSVFRIDVTARKDADLALVEQALSEEIARLVSEGPRPDEVMERAVTAEAQLLGRLQSLRTRADKLNEYLYFFGEPDSLQRDLDRYRNATQESVQNVARQVLLPNARLVQWILPEGIEHVASGRDERPGPAPQGAFAPPSTRTFTLSNGIPVDLWVRPGLPLVAAEVLLMPGPRRGDLPAPTATPGVRVVGPEGMVDALDRAGLASLVASMTQEGAGQRDAVAFAQAVAALGGTMTAGSDHASLSISLQVLARHVDAGMTLLADAVLRPRMGPADFERVKRLRQDAIRQQEDRPMTVAGQVAARVLCGPRNPYAWSTLGTEDTVSRLTLDDVRDLYRALFRPACARIFIAGDVTEDKARSTLEEAFGGWRNQGSVSQGPDDLAIPPPSGLRFVVVDRPDAVQTAVYLACPGVPQSDPRRLPLELVHTILGGSFTSRLNRNLREVHGFTYGAFSSQVPHRKIGLMTAQSAVMAESTGAAVREFLGELVRIASGDITPAEVAKARETVKNDITESFGTLRGILANATDLAVRGASLSDVAADLEGIGSLDAARLTAVARDLIRLDRSVLVLVGDRKLILEQTKDLPLPAPEFVDAKGEPLPKESRGR